MARQPHSALRVEQLESRDVPNAVWGDVEPGRYIVTLRPGVDAQAFANEVRDRGHAVSHVYTQAVNGIAYTGTPLGADARVLAVEPDRVVSIESLPRVAGRPVSPPPPPPPAQVVPTGVARIGGTGGTGENYHQVNVAVIDTGIDGTHPDLNVVGGRNFTSNKPENWADDNGHGTHVAGTAAARDNAVGVVGVAPGASLWAVKVLNRQGFGSLSGIVAGIDWVTATRTDGVAGNDIAVANMSLGIYGTSAALENAIRNSVNAGVVYVVAAMNASTDAANYSPASYPMVITVSALADSDGRAGGLGPATSAGADDTLATFSNYGAVVDIAAPGVDIYSTLRGGGYGLGSGTSMAAPHVAGAAARYIAQYGGFNGSVYTLPDADAVGVAESTLASTAQPMTDWRPDDVDINSDPDPWHEGLVQILGETGAAGSLAVGSLSGVNAESVNGQLVNQNSRSPSVPTAVEEDTRDVPTRLDRPAAVQDTRFLTLPLSSGRWKGLIVPLSDQDIDLSDNTDMPPG